MLIVVNVQARSAIRNISGYFRPHSLRWVQQSPKDTNSDAPPVRRIQFCRCPKEFDRKIYFEQYRAFNALRNDTKRAKFRWLNPRLIST